MSCIKMVSIRICHLNVALCHSVCNAPTEARGHRPRPRPRAAAFARAGAAGAAATGARGSGKRCGSWMKIIKSMKHQKLQPNPSKKTCIHMCFTFLLHFSCILLTFLVLVRLLHRHLLWQILQDRIQVWRQDHPGLFLMVVTVSAACLVSEAWCQCSQG